MKIQSLVIYHLTFFICPFRRVLVSIGTRQLGLCQFEVLLDVIANDK
jgi:hypothetical protein